MSLPWIYMVLGVRRIRHISGPDSASGRDGQAVIFPVVFPKEVWDASCWKPKWRLKRKDRTAYCRGGFVSTNPETRRVAVRESRLGTGGSGSVGSAKRQRRFCHENSAAIFDTSDQLSSEATRRETIEGRDRGTYRSANRRKPSRWLIA